MRISADTDTGRVRLSNQDCYAIGELPGGGAWAVVCDGMGGHSGGNVASQIATDTIGNAIKENFRASMSLASVMNMLTSSFNAANVNILEKASSDMSLYGMGTTAVVAICTDSHAVIAHVGDSRCYLISDDGIKQITKDHSLVRQLVDSGYITEEQAENHPQKNIITRALGIGDELDVDFSEIDFEHGNKLLLCTDGLTNHVKDGDIADCLSDDRTFDYAVRLIDRANEGGGRDNITAVIIAN